MNNPNLPAVEMTPAQDREYAEMQAREIKLSQMIKRAENLDLRNTAAAIEDDLADHRAKMAAFLEDLGITEL